MFRLLWCLVAQRKGMVITMKKIVLSSIFIFVLLLTACNAKVVGDLNRAADAASSTPAQSLLDPQEPAVDLTLRYQCLPLPGGVDKALGQCYLDGRVYSFDNGHGPVVGFTDLDGSTGTFEIPAEDDYIHAVCPAGDQLAVLAGSFPMYYEDAAGTFYETQTLEGEYEILLYRADGELGGRIELEKRYMAQTDSFFDMTYFDGSYYLLAPHQITRVGADGAELGRSALDTAQNYWQLDACAQGLLLGVGDINTLQSFCKLDTGTLTPQSEFSFDGKALTGLGFDAEGRLLVCDETNAVRRVDWDAQTGEKVFSWSENAQTSAQNYQRFYELDGAWLALQSTASGVSLYRVYDGAPPEKIKLTLTEVGIFDSLGFLVDDFNRSNEQYEIELIRHTENMDADKLRIQAELTANPSDLYAGWLDGNLPLNERAFVDLKPWMKADGEICDALVPSLWQRLCKNGACYSLPYEFSLRTWYGEAALFDHAGISVEELDEIVSASQYDYALDGTYCDSNQLANLALLAPEIYADVSAGTCRFTDPAFIRMLELCKQADSSGKPDIPDAVALGVHHASSALRMRTIQSAKSIDSAMYQYVDDSYHYTQIEDFVYVGYPNDVCNGSAFILGSGFAVSARSEHKTGAWEFIRFVLSEQAQGKGVGFAVNDAALRRSVDDQLALKVYDEQDAQRFYDALYDATILGGACPEISDIVLDEGMGYLNDQITAEQAAENIQSRVLLYIQEQKLG